MTVKVSKPAINVREELADLKKPTGIAGQAMLAAETPQEQFNLIGAGRRNLLINGAMQVAQRGTSETGVNVGTFHTVDRFQYAEGSGGGSGALTESQSTEAPDGFANSYKFEVTTTDTLSGGENVLVRTRLEGQDLQRFKFGTSAAEKMTVSFFVRASETGTYGLQIMIGPISNESAMQSYTVNSANTWEYKTVTFDGSTSYSIPNDFSRGFDLNFMLDCGPDDLTSPYGFTTTGAFKAPTEQVNFMATSGATWQITGVQLEVGKVATPFEHRSYGEELALCQRYYVQYELGSYQRLAATSYCDINNRTQVDISLPVPLRSYVSAGHTNLTINGQAVNGINLTQTGSNGNILTGNLTCPGTPLTVGTVYQVYAIGTGNFYVNGEL